MRLIDRRSGADAGHSGTSFVTEVEVELEEGDQLVVGQHLRVVDLTEVTPEQDARRALHELAAGHDVLLAGSANLLEHDLVRALITHLTPPLEKVAGRGALLQARRNAEARVELAQEFGVLTAFEIAELVASSATNQSATATRWRRADRIFSVSWDGATVYPGFQFDDDGRPLDVIARVLLAVEDQLRGWPLALWFTADNGWLDGARPVDALRSDPDQVVEAARQLVADLPA